MEQQPVSSEEVAVQVQDQGPVQEVAVQEVAVQDQVAENLTTPDGFANFEASLVQGFLNVIARKNAAQRTLSKISGDSTKLQRTDSIQNALTKVKNMPNLGEYTATAAFGDAVKNAKSYFSNWGKGGKITRKRSKKAKKARKTRRR